MRRMHHLQAQWTILSVALFTLLWISACSDDDTTTPPTDNSIKEDLFPLVVGHQITYSGYLRDKTTDTNIIATGAVYETKWTIASNAILSPLGNTANLIYDSTRVPTGIPVPPVITVASPLFVDRNPPTGNANFSFLQTVGTFFRKFGIQRLDSLRWILIAKLDAGIGTEWSAFDSTWITPPTALPPNTPVRLQIVGKFEAKEDLTLAGQTFSTYRLQTTRKIYLGGSTTPSATSPTATIWLAPNVGPVKIILNADGENVGHYREFKSKNF